MLIMAALFTVLTEAAVAPVNEQVPVSAKLLEETVDLAPKYTFSYDVQDAITGDSKAHIENRNGDVVEGQYSLNEPDGTRRIVDYRADPVNGFKAVVRKAPLVVVAEPAVVAEPFRAQTLNEPLVAKAIAAPLVARLGQKIAASNTRAEKLEELDTVAVEAAPGDSANPDAAVESVPAFPPLAAVPTAKAATRHFQSSYIASPVFTTYSRLALPFTYAIV